MHAGVIYFRDAQSVVTISTRLRLQKVWEASSLAVLCNSQNIQYITTVRSACLQPG